MKMARVRSYSGRRPGHAVEAAILCGATEPVNEPGPGLVSAPIPVAPEERGARRGTSTQADVASCRGRVASHRRLIGGPTCRHRHHRRGAVGDPRVVRPPGLVRAQAGVGSPEFSEKHAGGRFCLADRVARFGVIDECRKHKGVVVGQQRRARRRRHAVARPAQRWPGASACERPVLEPGAGFWVGSSLRGWPPLILRVTAKRSAALAAPLCGAARLQPKECATA